MDCLGLLLEAKRLQAGDHDILQIGLPRIDHVVDPGAAPE